MPQDNVLSLNAFGEIIEPKSKRQYPGQVPAKPEPPAQDAQIIPLKKVSPDEEPNMVFPMAGKTKVEGRNARGSEQANCVAAKVLMYMAQTKLLHWQTISISEHESLDKLFEDLVELGDELVESVMGKYGRPQLGDDMSTMTLTNYENPENPDGLPRFLSNIDDCFRNVCAPLFSQEKDPEIHNLIQEILGKIDKISYLLTLRK